MIVSRYVHGYSDRENERLREQASTLDELLHHDTFYSPGSKVLEAGCGVGAQTVILAGRHPKVHFTSIDVSLASIETARASLKRQGLDNVTFCPADILDLPFGENSFDHVFVCFVLEHLRQPDLALERLKTVLKPGGTITVIEGDHASARYYPESQYADRVIDCLIKIQADMGGNALIGRELYPLLRHAGFRDVRVTPRQVYADASRPEWVRGFTKNTFIAMVEGAKEQAIGQGLVEMKAWEKGIADLYTAAGEDGTFSYTFFKGIAVK